MGNALPRVGAGSEDEVERLSPVAYDVDLVGQLGLRERSENQGFVIRIVLNQQDRAIFHHVISSLPRP